MEGGSQKHVCLFEKESQLRAALEAALESQGTLISCFSAEQDCLQGLSEKPCDLFIIDLDGCEAEGLTMLAEIRRMAPWISTLAVVEHAGVRCAVKAIKAGASDCLEKPVPQERLVRAVEAHLDRVDAPVGRSRRALTHMEIQVLQLILAGKTSRDIAVELHRSKRTIDVHRKNIMRKLGAVSQVDLIRRAMGMGFVDSQGQG